MLTHRNDNASKSNKAKEQEEIGMILMPLWSLTISSGLYEFDIKNKNKTGSNGQGIKKAKIKKKSLLLW